MLHDRSSGNLFDAAVVDMQMPGMDGIALARAIKMDRSLEKLPIVMLSGLGRRLSRSGIEETGLAACLTKPVRQNELLETLSIILGGGSPKSAPEPATSVQERRRFKSRILLVEDNFVNQQVAMGLLKKMGLSADLAEDGVMAVDALKKISYDLVLMDVQMPNMDGFEATKMIRNPLTGVRDPNVVIIAMTANAMKGDREDCLKAGMNDYISKPVSMRNLADTLEKWLSEEN